MDKELDKQIDGRLDRWIKRIDQQKLTLNFIFILYSKDIYFLYINIKEILCNVIKAKAN